LTRYTGCSTSSWRTAAVVEQLAGDQPLVCVDPELDVWIGRGEHADRAIPRRCDQPATGWIEPQRGRNILIVCAEQARDLMTIGDVPDPEGQIGGGGGQLRAIIAERHAHEPAVIADQPAHQGTGRRVVEISSSTSALSRTSSRVLATARRAHAWGPPRRASEALGGPPGLTGGDGTVTAVAAVREVPAKQ
jgi:hypothetical protein